jgi:hypothetical protein
MSNSLAQELIVFVRQNGGRLPKKRRSKEFKLLTDDEIVDIKNLIAVAYGLLLNPIIWVGLSISFGNRAFVCPYKGN